MHVERLEGMVTGVRATPEDEMHVCSRSYSGCHPEAVRVFCQSYGCPHANCRRNALVY